MRASPKSPPKELDFEVLDYYKEEDFGSAGLFFVMAMYLCVDVRASPKSPPKE